MTDQPSYLIVDLSTNAMGGYATRLLASYGAEVIKVEPPRYGEPTRAVGPFPGDRPDPNAGALSLFLDVNKKSVTLDIEKPTGRATLDRLLEQIAVASSPRVRAGARSGSPDLVEVSAMEAMLSASRYYVTTYAYRKLLISRLGTTLSPTYCYRPANDGWAALCATTDQQRELLAHIMELSEHLDDPAFAPAAAGLNPLQSKVANLIDAWRAHARGDFSPAPGHARPQRILIYCR